MSYCRLRSRSSDTFFKCHFRCFKTQRREQLLTLLVLQSMISASRPSLPCPACASSLSIYYNSLFSVTGCVKVKTRVCLGSDTSCLLVLLVLKYTGQACLNKKVDINIPNKYSFCSWPNVFLSRILFLLFVSNFSCICA